MMKSTAFFVSAIVLLASSGAMGQSRFQIGFKTGVNFSSLTGTEPEMNESFASIESQPFVGNFFSYQYNPDFLSDAAVRFSASVNASYRLMDKAYVQLGIGYAGRGMNLHDDGEVYTSQGVQNSETMLSGAFSYKRNIKLNYLSVPVNFNYYLGLKKRFFITAGAYVDFLLSSKVSGEQHYATQMDVVTDGQVQSILTEGESKFNDENAHTSPYDIGVVYGGGIDVPLNHRLNVLFTLTMNQGFHQIDGKYDNDTQVILTTSGFVITHSNYYGLNSNARNLTVNASIGIAFQL